jgi:hypothetical protein
MLLTGRSNRKAAAENRKWRTVHLREKTELWNVNRIWCHPQVISTSCEAIISSWGW